MRADEAARDSVQTIAARVIGGWSACLEQRRLEQLIQRHFGRVAASGQQRCSMGRRRQQGQGREQVARRGCQVGHRRGEHLAKHFAFGAGEPLADALDGLTATQLADRPAGQQWVARGRSQGAGARRRALKWSRTTHCRFHGLGQGATHLGCPLPHRGPAGRA